MFSSISWPELLILLLAGLIILGPERLPGTISAAMGMIRKARNYMTGATEKIREELGGDFDQIIAPLQEVGKLRNITPGALFSEHILGGKTLQEYMLNSDGENAARTVTTAVATLPAKKIIPLQPGELPPFDYEAT